MTSWGVFLIILGAGSLLLPALGFQFRLMELVDDYQPYAGIAVAAIGAVLVFLGMRRRQAAAEAAPPATTASGNPEEPPQQP
jgi:hypothetical protein